MTDSNVNIENVKNLLRFLHLAEKLKCITRHGWTSSGRQESVADHCWRLALMVIFCARFTDTNINLEKALKMALLHDIAESITGDIPYFLARDNSPEKALKKKEEEDAMLLIKKMLGESFKEEVIELWKEYESNQTYEAKVVKAIDKLEAQIQQNEASLDTWLDCETVDATQGYINQYCQFDSFLLALSKEVIKESRIKVEDLKSSSI